MGGSHLQSRIELGVLPIDTLRAASCPSHCVLELQVRRLEATSAGQAQPRRLLGRAMAGRTELAGGVVAAGRLAAGRTEGTGCVARSLPRAGRARPAPGRHWFCRLLARRTHGAAPAFASVPGNTLQRPANSTRALDTPHNSGLTRQVLLGLWVFLQARKRCDQHSVSSHPSSSCSGPHR